MSAGDIAAIFGGAVVTVSLSLIGILIGLPIGLGLALLRWANVPVIAKVVVLYVSVLRATPLVTLLLLLFFALPNIGVPINPISAAILALVMNTSAFNCEVWRSALAGASKKHDDAARSGGVGRGEPPCPVVLAAVRRGMLLRGLANPTMLSALSAVAALVLGCILTPALMSKQRLVSWVARAFVDGMRCVPFLLFAYIVYYGFPSFGVRLDNWTSGLAALSIYKASYMAAILRGAWAAQPREPIEAGVAFGFPEIRLFRRIILPPLLLSAEPFIFVIII